MVSTLYFYPVEAQHRGGSHQSVPRYPKRPSTSSLTYTHPRSSPTRGKAYGGRSMRVEPVQPVTCCQRLYVCVTAIAVL